MWCNRRTFCPSTNRQRQRKTRSITLLITFHSQMDRNWRGKGKVVVAHDGVSASLFLRFTFNFYHQTRSSAEQPETENGISGRCTSNRATEFDCCIGICQRHRHTISIFAYRGLVLHWFRFGFGQMDVIYKQLTTTDYIIIIRDTSAHSEPIARDKRIQTRMHRSTTSNECVFM